MWKCNVDEDFFTHAKQLHFTAGFKLQEEPLLPRWSIFTVSQHIGPTLGDLQNGKGKDLHAERADLYQKRPVSISSETGIACSSAEVSLGSLPECVVKKSDAVLKKTRGGRSAYSCILSSSLSPEWEKLQLCLYPPSRLVSDLPRAWME